MATDKQKEHAVIINRRIAELTQRMTQQITLTDDLAYHALTAPHADARDGYANLYRASLAQLRKTQEESEMAHAAFRSLSAQVMVFGNSGADDTTPPGGDSPPDESLLKPAVTPQTGIDTPPSANTRPKGFA
jgi:hypothetical protein